MANFQSNFIVAVTVKQLEQLRALRQELDALRALGGKGSQIAIKIDTSTIDPALKEIKRKVREAGQDVGAQTATSVGGTGRSQSSGELTRAVQALTTELQRRRPGAPSPAAAAQATLATAGRGDYPAHAQQVVNKLRAEIKRLRDETLREMQKTGVELSEQEMLRLGTRVGRLEDRIKKVTAAMSTGGGKKTSVTVPVGAGTTPSVGQAAVTFDLKPLQATLDSLARMIQQKIVGPLSKLADIDLTGLGTGAARAGRKRRGGAAAAPGAPADTYGPELTDEDLSLLERGKQRASRQAQETVGRRARAQAAAALRRKEAFDKLDDATRERVEQAAQQGLVFVPGGLPGLQPSNRGRTSDVILAELHRRASSVALSAGRAPLREDIQTFPPGANEGLAGQLRLGDPVTTKLVMSFAKGEASRIKDRLAELKARGTSAAELQTYAKSLAADAQQAVERKFDIPSGEFSFFTSRNADVVPKRITASKGVRMLESINRSIEALEKFGDTPEGQTLTAGLARSMRSGLRRGLRVLKPVVEALETGTQLTPEGKQATQAQFEKILQSFPFLKQFAAPGFSPADIRSTYSSFQAVQEAVRLGSNVTSVVAPVRGQMIAPVATRLQRLVGGEGRTGLIDYYAQRAQDETLSEGQRKFAAKRHQQALEDLEKSLPTPAELAKYIQRQRAIEKVMRGVRSPLKENALDVGEGPSARMERGSSVRELTQEEIAHERDYVRARVDRINEYRRKKGRAALDFPAAERELERLRDQALQISKGYEATPLKAPGAGEFLPGSPRRALHIPAGFAGELDRIGGFLSVVGQSPTGAARLAQAEALLRAGGAGVGAPPPPPPPPPPGETPPPTGATPPPGGGDWVGRIIAELQRILAAIERLGAAKGPAGTGGGLPFANLTPEERKERFDLRGKQFELSKQREQRLASAAHQKGAQAEYAINAKEQLGLEALGQFGPADFTQVTDQLFRDLNSMATMQDRLNKLLARIKIRQNRGANADDLRRQFGTTGESLLAQYGTVNRLVDYATQVYPKQFAPVAGDVDALRGAYTKRVQTQEKLRGATKGSDEEVRLQELLRKRIDLEEKLGQRVRQRAAAVVQSIRASEREHSFFERFNETLRRVLFYTGASFLVYRLTGALGAAAQEAIRLESSVARISGVLGGGGIAQRRDLRAGIIGAAQDFGVPLEQASSAIQTFAQAGYRGPQAVTAARAALAGQVGAGLEAGQAQELLIAIDHISNGAITFENILDRISRVEATRAVTAQDLAVALQRTGSLASQLQPNRQGNVDFADLVIGATTAIVERTRVSGNQAATGLRFILSRLAAPEIANRLQTGFGINLAANKEGTELRSLYDILADVARKYKELSDPNQPGGPRTAEAFQLLNTVGGARQVNLAAALLGNFQDALATARESSQAMGDTARRVAIQMDTLEKKLEQTKAAFSGFISSLLEKSGLLEAMKAVVDGLGKIFKAGAGSAASGGVGIGVVGALAGLGGGLLGQAGHAVEAKGVAKSLVALRNLGKFISLLGSAIAPFGLLLTAVGVVIAVATLLHRKSAKLREEAERYGRAEVANFNPEQLDVVKKYKETAVSYGFSQNEFYARVSAAATTAREQVLNKYPNAGPFFTGGKVPKIPDFREDLTKAFVDALSKNVPEIGRIEDPTERRRVALELLKNSALVGSERAGRFSADLQHDLQQEEEQIRARLEQSARSAPISAQGAFAGLSQEEIRRLRAPQGAGFGYRASSVRARFGLGATDEIRGQPLELLRSEAYREASALFGKPTGALLGTTLPGGETVLDRVVESMVKNGSTLGQAFDDLAQTVFKSAEGLKLLDKAIDRAIDTGFIEQPGPGVTSTASGGQQFGDLFLKRFVERGRLKVKEYRERNLPAQAKELEELLNAQESPEGAGAFKAILGKRLGRGHLRDRLLDVLLQFTTAREGDAATAQYFSGAGLSFDLDAARAASSQQALRGLAGVPAQIRADLIRNRSRLIGAGATEEDIRAAVEEGGRSQFSAGTLKRINAAFDKFEQLPEAETQNLLRNVETLSQAVKAVTGREDVLGRLDKTDREKILGLAQAGPADLIAPANYDLLIRVFQQLADADQARLRAKIAQNRELERQVVLEQQVLEHQQTLSQIGRESAVRRADILGGPGAGFRTRLAQLPSETEEARRRINAQFDAENKLAVAASTAGESLEDFREKIRAIEIKRETALARLGPEEEEKRTKLIQDFQDQVLQTTIQKIDQLVSQATAGLRQILTDPELSRKTTPRQLIEATAGGIGQTMFQQIGNNFMDALTGPHGIFGGALRDLFRSPAQIEADLMYDATYKGSYEGTVDGNLYAQGKEPLYGGPNAKGIQGIVNAILLGGKAEGADNKSSIKKAVAQFVGTAGGTLIGDAISPHKGSNYSSEGAAVGSAIGSLIPGVGTIIGGVIGGIFGGLFGKKRPPAPLPEMQVLERIDRNTRETITAIENQTTQLLTLDSRLLNVPSTFTVPGYRPIGVGGGLGMEGGMTVQQSVSITITDSRDPEATAQAVARALRSESRRAGTFVSTRG